MLLVTLRKPTWRTKCIGNLLFLSLYLKSTQNSGQFSCVTHQLWERCYHHPKCYNRIGDVLLRCSCIWTSNTLSFLNVSLHKGHCFMTGHWDLCSPICFCQVGFSLVTRAHILQLYIRCLLNMCSLS